MLIKNNPKEQLIRQLNNFYGINEKEISIIDEIYPRTIAKIATCFKHINNKYYHDEHDQIFNPLHVAQWTMFLYLMSRYSKDYFGCELCDKLYGLNKCISSADIFYGVDMPNIWFFDHPQGSVMGRAQYSDFFTFSQGCTVGNNKGVFPQFGEHVSMLSNSKILGNCKVGDHVILSANSYLLDQDIPSYSIVFGISPNIIIKSITPEKFEEITGSMFNSKGEDQDE